MSSNRGLMKEIKGQSFNDDAVVREEVLDTL